MENNIRKIRSSQVSAVNEHTQLLEDNLTRKDQEILRLKQSNQLLQANIDELTL